MADVEEGRRGARLPEQVMLPLLERITAQSLDEDYRVVAEQKATRRDGVSGFSNPRRSWLIAAAVVAVFGVLVSTAAVQTSRNADVDSASRATLIERIENQRDRVGEQQERIARLRGSNADEEQRTSAELGVSGIPALLLFRGGRLVAKTAGAMDTGKIVAWARGQLAGAH